MELFLLSFAVLASAIGSATTSPGGQTLLAIPANRTTSLKVERTGSTCVFPCHVQTQNGEPLPHPPKVTWQRDHGGAFRNLNDGGYWSDEKINVAYSIDRHQTCKEVEDPSNGKLSHYDCDFVETHCDLGKHEGVYQCVVEYQHKLDNFNITLESHLLDGPRDPDVRYCFLPKPEEFSVQYRAGQSLTLSWQPFVQENSTICPGGEIYEVRSRWYDTYDAYSTNRYLVNGSRDYERTIDNSTTYTLNISTIARGVYFVFDVKNEIREGQSKAYTPRHQVESSPVFYFDLQEPATLIAPKVDPLVLMAEEGGVVELRCVGRGIPAPSVGLYRHSLRITSESENPSVALKHLLVNQDTVGLYYCLASNVIILPQGGGPLPKVTSKSFIVEMTDSAVDLTNPLVCAPLGDSVCSDLFLDHHVLANSTDASLEAKVKNQSSLFDDFLSETGTIGSLSSETVRQCLDLARKVMCHSAFPFCNRKSLATRPICQRSCDVFRAGGACEGVVTPERFPEAYSIMNSRCDNNTYPGGDQQECVQLPLKQLAPSDVSWCSRGDGQTYAGNVYFTENDRLCQDWVAQSPHAHSAFEPSLLHRAARECRNPGGLGERPWCYTVDSQVRWEYCDVEQCNVCENYKGQFCSQLPGYRQRGAIFVDRHESEWDEAGQHRAENWMLVTFHGLMSGDLPAGCVEGLREFICHSTLPLCTDTTNTVHSQLCSDHCQLTELLQVCPGDILEKVQRKMRSSEQSFLQPVCSESSGRNCIPVQARLTVPPTAQITNDIDCYNSSTQGTEYTGRVTTTVSGATCQAWGANWPDLEDGNYCRNPGHMGLRPWCFTNREKGQWEYCDIPQCGTDKKPVTELEANPVREQLSSTTVGVIITFAVVGILLIVGSLILALTIAIVWRHRQKQREDKELSLLKLNRKKDWDYVVNQTYVQVGGLPPKIKEAIDNFPQYDKSSVKYIRQLGSGNFGVVFYARMEGVVEDQKSVEVAVKTLKEEYSTEGLDDFVREAKLMFSFDHPNIVKILGVCVDDLPYYLIFEYMDKGDLAQFLRASASSLQRREMNPTDGRPRSRTGSTVSDEPPALNVDQLADICRQVACGMEYLSNNNHVHRDLACRNCLVKSCDAWEQTESGLIIKIGDFGMSQNLYTSDYYRVRGQAVLPVRWMSPEAVIYGKFSTDSDVWSFGVVMWEVFSFAMQPYYGTSNEEVTEAIRRHKLLARPADCPSRMYEIMKNCWMLQPKMRPGFDELVKILSDCRLSVSSSDSQSGEDYCSDDSNSDLDSDAFYEENSDVDETATATTTVTTTTTNNNTTSA